MRTILFAFLMLGIAPCIHAQELLSSTRYECEQIQKKSPITCAPKLEEGKYTLIINAKLKLEITKEETKLIQYLVSVLTENFLARGGYSVEQHALFGDGRHNSRWCHLSKRINKIWCNPWEPVEAEK